MGTLVDTILGSGINYVTLAVPFFFVLIGIELVAGRVQHKSFYRLNDSINDLSCGIVDQIVGIFLKGLLFAGYLFLFENFRVFEIASAPPAAKWIAAIALMLGVDFCFYWFHRIAHEYACAVGDARGAPSKRGIQPGRGPATERLRELLRLDLSMPLAVIGFPPVWYLSMSALNLLYQFWVHTEAVGRLGPLEWCSTRLRIIAFTTRTPTVSR